MCCISSYCRRKRSHFQRRAALVVCLEDKFVNVLLPFAIDEQYQSTMFEPLPREVFLSTPSPPPAFLDQANAVQPPAANRRCVRRAREPRKSVSDLTTPGLEP